MGMNVRTLLILLAVFLMELPISTTWAQSPLIEGAKKEGELNWYTSMSAVDHTKYLELFNKKVLLGFLWIHVQFSAEEQNRYPEVLKFPEPSCC